MQKQVVEFNGEPVGALVPDGDRVRFIAVKFGVWSLDGRLFSNSGDAKLAVRALLSKSGRRAMPSASFWVPGDGDLSESQFGWNASSDITVAVKESRI